MTNLITSIIRILRSDSGALKANITGFVRICLTELERVQPGEKGCHKSGDELQYPLRRDVAQLGGDARYVSNDVNEPRELLET